MIRVVRTGCGILFVAAVVSCPGIPLMAAPENLEAFTFVQLCDPQLGMGGYEHDVASFARAVERVNALNPDFVLICGDLVHTPDAASFADFARIREGLKVPSHLASGNHDVGNEPTPESLAYYRETVGRDYYTFDHKGIRFVVVNTQLWKSPVDGESAKQDEWLRGALDEASARGIPIVVVGHYPLYLSDPDEGDEYMNLPRERRAELLALFEKSGVAAVLGGHTHRLLVNEYRGMQLVNGETTSTNFDGRPEGFRVWQVDGDGELSHAFVPLDGAEAGR